MNVQNRIVNAIKSSSIEIDVRDSQAVAVNFVLSQCFHFTYFGAEVEVFMRSRGGLLPLSAIASGLNRSLHYVDYKTHTSAGLVWEVARRASLCRNSRTQ